ncbi:alkaline protease [Bacillus sp. K6W]|uniref:alkaline protease n=1 Tax=Bacillus sp. K6W TaxID=2249215 RepID=UPI000DF76B9C|nr:alkaline protease [Bacillus sp. K6W]
MPDFEVTCEVETEATSCSGARKSAWSREDKVTAPEGFVINDREVEVHWHSQRGSENTFSQVFEDHVEIIPGTGLKFPRTMKVSVFARSSKGHCAGGGASKATFTGNFIKIQ